MNEKEIQCVCVGGEDCCQVREGVSCGECSEAWGRCESGGGGQA